MNDDLKTPQKRAFQYFYVDGAFEFGFGLLCLILGIYFYVENRLQGTRFAVLADSLLVFAVVGGAFLLNWLVRKWKERLTFPRTGYVNYPRIYMLKRGWRILIGLIAVGALGAAAVYLLSKGNDRPSYMPLMSGVLFGMVMFFVGWRTSLPRFYLQAVLSMLVGIGLAYSTLGNYVGLAAFYLAVSLILLISGALTLRKYLRQNPASREEPLGR